MFTLTHEPDIRVRSINSYSQEMIRSPRSKFDFSSETDSRAPVGVPRSNQKLIRVSASDRSTRLVQHRRLKAKC